MKLLHTSDVQLDAPFAFLGEQGKRHREQLLETFAKIVALAQRHGYQMLLISGDLFDSNRPSQRTCDFVAVQLQNLTVPVCILPGNHDCYDAGSIYRKMDFPGNVTIFTDALTSRVFPDLDTTVYGKAVLRRDSRESPLHQLHPTGDTRWHIALAHGNLTVGRVDSPNRPIAPEEIAICDMDYVALGDWHTFADYSQGKVKAAYSGSPEPTEFDHKEAGFVAGVTLNDSGVQVNKIRVGTISADRIQHDVSGLSEPALVAALRERADPHLMLEVVLTGLSEIGTVMEPANIEQELAGDFYHIVCRDQSHPGLDDISAAVYPPEHVTGKFITLMKQWITEATDEAERQRAERARQLGVVLLQGKEVL